MLSKSVENLPALFVILLLLKHLLAYLTGKTDAGSGKFLDAFLQSTHQT